MKHAAILTLLIATALIGPAAHADCVMPAATVSIPDANTATREEIVAANIGLRGFDQGVSDYLSCLEVRYENTVRQKKLSKDQQKELERDYLAKRDAAIQAVQEIAERFNAVVKAYRSRTAK